MPEEKRLPAVFELCDTTLSKAAPEVLGLWATVPAAGTTTVAFGVATVSMSTAPVWRANLPANLRLATAYLERGETRIHTSQHACTAARDRFNTLLAARTAGLSFDVATAVRTSAHPESELLAILRELQEGRSPVSFGLGARLMGGWEQAAQTFQAAVERLRQFFTYYAWVETRLQEQLLGQTAISWTGHVDTVWQAALDSQQVQLHQRTLALALQSHNTLLHTLVMATQFAMQLSALLSMPGGVILALPAAWKFIHQVLAEYSQQPEETEERDHG